MSESPDTLAQQIAELEAARREIEARLHVLQAAAPTGDAVAGDKVGGDKVAGDKIVDLQGMVDVRGTAHVAVGINYGRIVYGRDASDDERRILGSYLARLAAALYRLPLRGLEKRLDQGDGVALPQVYVTLATGSLVVLASGGAKELRRYFQDGKLDQPLKQNYDPNHAPPDRAIVQNLTVEPGAASGKRRRKELMLGRALLATEAVYQRDHLVLLGDPGSGKSTFVRHLAWALAQRGLDQPSAATTLVGWDDQPRVLPIIVSLRALAGRLAGTKTPETEVFAALCAAIAGYDIAQADELLNPALDRGAALILFDGLDEAPLDAVPGLVADRAATLRAVRAFAEKHARARFVITCRTRAFTEDLRDLLGWHIETIAPFTLGQIRQFIPAWYGELVAKRQVSREQAGRLSQQLLDSILGRPKLRAMADTPLLLTLMALVLFNNNELPRDRPQLYERILDLLLGQWDQVRDGQSLGESIGLPDWDSERLRPLLDQLFYTAHLQVRSADGRGRLARRDVREALEHFLRIAGLRGDQAAATAVRCLDYFEQRSGLLAPDASDDYTFAHLTLQEHGAGRFMAVQSDDPTGLMLQHRADDRWREPIMLGAGLLRPADLNTLLADLIDPEEQNSAKSIKRRQKDLILAAEIGGDRDWNMLRTRPAIKIDRLQRDLKRGLVALLADRDQPLPVAERVRAGFLLGDLGDPRFPVTIEEWQFELAKVQVGDTTGYFCRIDAGTYIIGSTDDDFDADNHEKPQHAATLDGPFWIARYPITNDQWQAWVEQAGGKPS